LAVSARFLQKRGLDTTTAMAAVGVDTLAGVMVHFTLTGLFILLAGSSGLGTFELPSWRVIALIAGEWPWSRRSASAVPWSRALVTKRCGRHQAVIVGVADIARQPIKMIELFGGCLTITMGYILALAVSVSAYGGGPAFTSVAIVYLVGSMVSSVAPTPEASVPSRRR
jgi:hypothetical protein